MQRFEDIIAWQRSQKIAIEIYKIFKNNKDYSFRDQIQRCSISISNNIAEWFERRSNNEFRHFLYISKWSCWELRSMLYLANEFNYISKSQFENLYNESIEISKIISWFIKTL